MNLLTRTPRQLQILVRAAQDTHHKDIQVANARLIKKHNAIMSEVSGRQRAITEQIKLLTAEGDGLSKIRKLIPNSQT